MPDCRLLVQRIAAAGPLVDALDQPELGLGIRRMQHRRPDHAPRRGEVSQDARAIRPAPQIRWISSLTFGQHVEPVGDGDHPREAIDEVRDRRIGVGEASPAGHLSVAQRHLTAGMPDPVDKVEARQRPVGQAPVIR
ncbi:hypothetical protein D9M70_584160 [compost metagenome]